MLLPIHPFIPLANMIPINNHSFTPVSVSVEVEFTHNSDEKCCDVIVKHYDFLGNYIGCNSLCLGNERMFYFEKNDEAGAMQFVLECLGIQQISESFIVKK